MEILINFQEGTQSDVDREKRKIFGPDVGFGIKNAVLGYVFGVSNCFFSCLNFSDMEQITISKETSTIAN